MQIKKTTWQHTRYKCSQHNQTKNTLQITFFICLCFEHLQHLLSNWWRCFLDLLVLFYLHVFSEVTARWALSGHRSIWLLTLIITVVPVMFTVVHKGSWRQAKMDVTWLNSVLCLSIYSECDDDCAFSTCWVVGEWKKGRCHMSSPDLCSQGKKISWTQFSTLSSVINKQFTRTPKQATIFQPSIVCHPVSSQRQPLTPASSQHIQGSEVILVWWRVTLLKNTCGDVFWDHGIMSAKHGKSLLISSLFSSTSCFLLERVNDWLNTLMILSPDAYVASLYAGLFML